MRAIRAKPAELLAQQSTKFALVINSKIAATLHLDIPLSILMRVAEVDD
jgi:hypothetical protein